MNQPAPHTLLDTDLQAYSRALLAGDPDAESHGTALAAALAHGAHLHAVLTATRAEHIPDDVWSCGMRSIGEVEVRHSSHRTYPASLTCTLDDGHDGPHVDQNCCWLRHEFTDAQEGTRLDRRSCSCGRRLGRCQTSRLLDTLGYPPPAVPGDKD